MEILASTDIQYIYIIILCVLHRLINYPVVFESLSN